MSQHWDRVSLDFCHLPNALIQLFIFFSCSLCEVSLCDTVSSMSSILSSAACVMLTAPHGLPHAPQICSLAFLLPFNSLVLTLLWARFLDFVYIFWSV